MAVVVLMFFGKMQPHFLRVGAVALMNSLFWVFEAVFFYLDIKKIVEEIQSFINKCCGIPVIK